jgi:hypothetical protein
MRYLLPQFRPGELLGGWWIRAVRKVGLPVRTVARMVAGRKWAPGFFQVAEAAQIAETMGANWEDLLWLHTVFPYATAFFERPVFNQALRAAGASGPAAAGMGAVTQSVSDQVPYRRFCRACAAEEFARWRESVWHREHNLPGVLVCLKHGAWLWGTDQPTTGQNLWVDELPHEARGVQLFRRPLTTFDIELARRSVAVLHRTSREPTGRGALWYRARLIELGLLSETRDVDKQKLAEWFRSFPAASPSQYGFPGKAWDSTWLAFMLRPGTGQPHIPLKHFLFETALALQGPVSEALIDHVPSGPSMSDTTPRDREYAAAVQKLVAAYVKRGERARVRDVLTQVGCWGSFRHASTAFPLTAKAVAELKSSPAACRPNWGKGLKRDRRTGQLKESP